MRKHSIQRARIMIVDDSAAAVLNLEAMLQNAGYAHIVGTTDAKQAGVLYRAARPDAVLLALDDTHLWGFQVLSELGELLPRGTHLPVLAMSPDASPDLRRRALEAGADDFVTKPLDADEVTLRLSNLLRMQWSHEQLQNQKQHLEARVRQRTRELEDAELEMLERLAIAAEYRDDDTGQHTQRVSRTAALLAHASGLPHAQVELIAQAAPLHDIGKIGIADGILLKTGPLTSEEIETMRAHTTIGAKILSGSRSQLLQLAEEIALSHHEHWNGAGYPFAVEGAAIPLPGRIVAIADVFDALTNERPYKKAWPAADAIAEIARLSGTQFDPDLVRIFLKLPHDELMKIAPGHNPHRA